MFLELIKKINPQTKMKSAALKVLSVDDSPTIFAHLEYVLKDLNFVDWVGHAYKISCARAMVSKFNPDVVLLDIMVDDESGFDLLQYLKKEYPAIKIFMLSNLTDAVYNKKSIKMGASHYIDKSFEFHTIEDLLEIEHEHKNELPSCM